MLQGQAFQKKHLSERRGGSRAGVSLIGFSLTQAPGPLVATALGAGEVRQDFGGVAFGSDDGPDRRNFAGFADQERTSHDAHEFASHELPLLPRTVSFAGLVAGIAKQREIESIFGLEQGLCIDGVGAHAQDGDLEFVELFLCVAKLGRFDDSTGSVGFGEEEQQNAFPLEIFERDGFVFVGWEAERGGFVAGLEHGIPRSTF